MTINTDDSLFGFYASFNMEEPQKDIVKQFLWAENGLKSQLNNLNQNTYGQDFQLILFEFYVNPIPQEKQALKEIGNYRSKEKSIGIPVIIDQVNFFSLNQEEKWVFLFSTILKKLELLKVKVNKNKLDLKIDRLIYDTSSMLKLKKGST